MGTRVEPERDGCGKGSVSLRVLGILNRARKVHETHGQEDKENVVV